MARLRAILAVSNSKQRKECLAGVPSRIPVHVQGIRQFQCPSGAACGDINGDVRHFNEAVETIRLGLSLP